MHTNPRLAERLLQAVSRERLLDTAVRLISVPSRTCEAGAAADRLAEILKGEGFTVERPVADHPPAPAVVVRFDSGRPGRTLQYNGHLDTVHLPFVPPQVDGDQLTGSGSSDMKGGIAAAVEALRRLHNAEALPSGAILLTAHDLHESPWGDGRQVDRLITDGYVGDGVLLPEYLCDRLPVIGRGGLVWRAALRRPGAPIHEVMRPDEPNVIAAGADMVHRLRQLDRELSAKSDPRAGPESLFIGQVHSGEIYNQYPQECRLEGTRRWLPGTRQADAEAQLRTLAADVARSTGAAVEITFKLMRDAFLLDEGDPLVAAFQDAYRATAGVTLPVGAKPFVDDGNSFWSLARVPAITHGPRAGGPHTLNEWVSIDDLVRVARVYALTALAYCPAE